MHTDSAAPLAQPLEVAQDANRTHTTLATIYESGECSDSDTDCETTCSDPPQQTTVEVEVHSEAASNTAATVELAATETIQMSKNPQSAENATLSSENPILCVSESNNKEEATTRRPKLRHELTIDLDDKETDGNTNGSTSDSKTNTKALDPSAARVRATELWKRRPRGTGGRTEAPTSIPVRVPFSSTENQSGKLPIVLPSSAKQSTASLKTNAPSFFRQISRGSASPSTILTLEGRRGRKLRLKLPPRVSETAAV